MEILKRVQRENNIKEIFFSNDFCETFDTKNNRMNQQDEAGSEYIKMKIYLFANSLFFFFYVSIFKVIYTFIYKKKLPSQNIIIIIHAN